MSPNRQQHGPKVSPVNNMYTALLGLVLLVLLGTIAFVALQYYSYYQTNIPMLK
ncbi:MAG: hypothetical protein ACYST2_03860 [Planctomycetota bacterium]|jgi:hypothetical protein